MVLKHFTMNWEINTSLACECDTAKSDIKSPIFYEGPREWYMTYGTRTEKAPGGALVQKGIIKLHRSHCGVKASLKKVTFTLHTGQENSSRSFTLGQSEWQLTPMASFWVKFDNFVVDVWSQTEGKRYVQCDIVIDYNAENPVTGESLAQDFQQMLGVEEFSDFKIKCSEEKVFYVNKSILSARSNYFKTMLKGDMKESKTGELDVKDVSPRAMEQVIKYIYTEKMDENIPVEIMKEVYATGHMYQIPGLMMMAEYMLGDKVNGRNVSNLLAFSQLYSMKNLRVRVLSVLKTLDISEIRL